MNNAPSERASTGQWRGERGERVHLAMLSRGYDGRLPQSGDVR